MDKSALQRVQTVRAAADSAKRLQQITLARAELMATAKTQAAERAALAQENARLQEAAKQSNIAEKWAAAKPMAMIGISYESEKDDRGLRITGFVKESSAEDSPLMIGDIITQVGDDLIAGLPSFQAFHKTYGQVGSSIEIVASRIYDDVKIRVAAKVMRDQAVPAMKAHLGLDSKPVVAGAQVTKIHPGTSASRSGLLEGDVINMVNDEWLSGLKMAELAEMLSGPAGSVVEICSTRVENGVKIRQTPIEIMRDCRMSPLVESVPQGPIPDQKKLSVGMHLRAEVGIKYQKHASGLQVIGFVKHSSAARSELEVGDVLTGFGDTFFAGLPAFEAFNSMSGNGSTTVEVVAFRMAEGTRKTRLTVEIERDVEVPAKEAVVGLTVKEDVNGLLITHIIAGTGAADSELMPGDVITTIDGDFISGMKSVLSTKKLVGMAGSKVEVGVSRVVDGVKRRFTALVVRDHNVTKLDYFAKIKEERAAKTPPASPMKTPTKPRRLAEGKANGGVPLSVVMVLLVLLIGAVFAALHYRKNCASLGSISAAGWSANASRASSQDLMVVAIDHAIEVMSDQHALLMVLVKDPAMEFFEAVATENSSSMNVTAISARCGVNSSAGEFRQRHVELSRNTFNDISAVLSLGISTAKSARELIDVLQTAREELNTKGKQIAAEAALLLAKTERLEADLSQETLARIGVESVLSKTSANLTKTWRLWQAVTADLTNERHGHSEERQKRLALSGQLGLERDKFLKLDQRLKEEQQISAVSRQQSRILAFMAPSPYLPNSGWKLGCDATPRPDISARDRWRVAKMSLKAKSQGLKKSRLGRLTRFLLGFFRHTQTAVKTPSSFFNLPTAAFLSKQEKCSEQEALQTSQAVEIEVAAQRRQLGSKDRELETVKRQLEEEQGRVMVAKREAELEAELREKLRTEGETRYALLREEHQLLARQKAEGTAQISALKRELQTLQQLIAAQEKMAQQLAPNASWQATCAQTNATSSTLETVPAKVDVPARAASSGGFVGGLVNSFFGLRAVHSERAAKPKSARTAAFVQSVFTAGEDQGSDASEVKPDQSQSHAGQAGDENTSSAPRAANYQKSAHEVTRASIAQKHAPSKKVVTDGPGATTAAPAQSVLNWTETDAE